jgi:putative nucleotidyltransferase with HDIG domain
MSSAAPNAKISPIASNFVASAAPPSPIVIKLAQDGVDFASIDELEKIVGRDPEFSLRVLALANSAFYSQVYDITTLRGALVLLGVDTVSKLAASILSRSLLSSSRRHESCVWRHSQAVGIGAELIAELNRRTNPRRAFVAGLLHDIGLAAILSYQGSASADIAEHGEIGAEVAECLGLSPQLVAAIRYHDSPPDADHPNALVETVCVANQFALRYGYAHDAETPKEDELFNKSLSRIGLGEADLEPLAIRLASRLETFEASVGSPEEVQS